MVSTFATRRFLMLTVKFKLLPLKLIVNYLVDRTKNFKFKFLFLFGKLVTHIDYNKTHIFIKF